MSSCTQALSWNIMCDYNPPYVKYEKNFSKNVKGCRDGCAKTTATRCRDGCMQARHYTRTTQVTRSLHTFLNLTSFCGLCSETTGKSTLK